MQQTLLVLLGVILVGLYGYSLHDRNSSEENSAIRREVESAALGVATDWSARIQQFRFDQAMIDAGVTTPPHVDSLDYTSPASSFGLNRDPGETDRCRINDVDDFHGFVDTTSYPLRFGDGDFRVEFAVRYADPVDVEALPSGGVSNVKVATITATYLDSPTAQAPAFDPPVRVSLDAVLSSAVLTIRHRMRDVGDPVLFTGCTPVTP